jgi:hypothetical protein
LRKVVTLGALAGAALGWVITRSQRPKRAPEGVWTDATFTPAPATQGSPVPATGPGD